MVNFKFKDLFFNKLHKIDLKLDNISKKLSFYAINPINVETEKKKFFENINYNPIFKYSEYKENLKEIRNELKEIKTNNTIIGKILEEIKQNYIDKTYLLQYRKDNVKFTKYSKKIYGSPNKKLLNEAKKFMHIKFKKETEIYTSKQVVNIFKFAFLKYGFPWNVKEKEMVSKAAVNTNKMTIYIKKDMKFSENFLKRLIVHEIGTHVARFENGKMQPYLFFKRGLLGYLKTEEGLAVYNEEINGCLNDYILKIYAGRVIAIDFALKYSFRETYENLRKYFNKDTAFRLTLRAKRGLGDTTKAGACTKDINYLKGYILIKKFIKNENNLNKLYYGKIGIEHVELIEKIPNLFNPKILPIFRHLNYITEHFSRLLKSIVDFPLISIKNINNKLTHNKPTKNNP
ncbi:MAG: tyrosine/phenylalanine carboxypeptidase domain-containing protein [Nanoarchaeota archaeon]